MADDATPLDGLPDLDLSIPGKPPADAPAADALLSQQKLEELLERKIPLEQQIAKACENQAIGSLTIGKGKHAPRIDGTLTIEKWSAEHIDNVIKTVERRTNKIGANPLNDEERKLRTALNQLKGHLESLKGEVNKEAALRNEHGFMSTAEWLELRNKVKNKLGIAPEAEIMNRVNASVRDPEAHAKAAAAASKATRINKDAPAVAEFKVNIGKAYEELDAIDKTLEDTYRALAKAAGSDHAAGELLLARSATGIPADLAENVRNALDAHVNALGKEDALLHEIQSLKTQGGKLAWAEGESCKALVDGLDHARNTATTAYRVELDAKALKAAEEAAENEARVLGKVRAFAKANHRLHASQNELVAAIEQLPEGKSKQAAFKTALRTIIKDNDGNPQTMIAQLRKEIQNGGIKGVSFAFDKNKVGLAPHVADFVKSLEALHDTEILLMAEAVNGHPTSNEQMAAIREATKASAKLGQEAVGTLHGHIDGATSIDSIVEHLQAAAKNLEKAAEDTVKTGGKGGVMKWVVGGAVAVVGALGLNAVLNNKPRTQIGERALVDAHMNQQPAAYR